MYKNRISRPTPNRHPQFFIRRSEIAFDKRVAYVESVCAVLNESRFGLSSVSPFVIDQSDHPELELAVFFDFDDTGQNGLVPCFDLSPQGRARYQLVEAAHRSAKQMGPVDIWPNALNSTAAPPPNQGRGSP